MKLKSGLGKKRPLIFIVPSLLGGGAERVLINLANYFNKQQVKVILIALNHGVPAYPVDDEIMVINLLKRKRSTLPHRIYYMLLTFYKLLFLLIKHRPACVLSFITSANIWTGITCNITRTAYIVSERTSPKRTINQFNFIVNSLTGSIYRKAKAVVVGTQAVEDCLRQNKAFKNLKNIKKITNAVTEFDPVTDVKVHKRKFILGVGRLAHIKGFDQLITAFSVANLYDTDLLIVGDGPERAGLVCQVYNLGLRDRVIFAGAKSNLQDFYSQAAVFVLPSRNEGYPNALVEAMSFGCPCIAMDCEFGPAEIIVDGQNGLLVSNGDIEALAGGIKHLIEDKALADTLRDNAKKINDTNSAEKVLKQWSGLILGC
ncbi:MAG: glycosyltransferase [Mucilaginibacter sp.]